MAADITRRCGLPEIALRSKRNSARQWMASLTRSGRPNVAPSCISKHQSPRPWVYYPTPPFDTPRQPMPGTTARMRRSAHTPNESSDRSHPFWAFRQEFHSSFGKATTFPSFNSPTDTAVSSVHHGKLTKIRPSRFDVERSSSAPLEDTRLIFRSRVTDFHCSSLYRVIFVEALRHDNIAGS